MPFVQHPSFDVALSAKDRSLALGFMASFAIGVKGVHQCWLIIRFVKVVTIGTAHVFRGFIFDQLTVFINMVAHAAVVDLGDFVVFIMHKHGWGALGIVKNRVVHNGHLVLGPGRGQAENN
jgi:hypothetical protein